MILARSTRLNQPGATVEIDPTNPLSHGLVGNINPAARNFQSVGAVAFKSTEGGVALLGTGASFAFKNVPLFGNGATLLFVGNWLTGGSHVAAIGNSGTGDQCFIFQAGATGTSRPRALIRTVNGGGITTAETLGSGNDTQYDQIEVWCARYDGTTALKLYRNGNDFTGGNANTSASGSISTLNNISLGGTNRGSDAFASSGQRQVLGLYWSRALSPAEIKEISRNPWQIFKPVQRRIYFDMGAGGGGEPATHDTSGTITSSPAELSGAAERTRQHDTSAELAGAGSVVSATARRNVTLGSSGALSVGLAVVTASASHTAGHAEHSTSGTVAAPGASLSGSASRVPAPVTHDTSGDLGGMGAVIDGQAQGPQTGSMRPGFEMSSRKVYIKRGKRIHIFDSVEDADAWMEAEQQEIQAIRRAKPTPRKKAKVFKALDEAIPHEVVRLDVVRAMVDYLGIPVEMPTLEARQDWAEVARVALMARQMQDEEDIELLLAA